MSASTGIDVCRRPSVNGNLLMFLYIGVNSTPTVLFESRIWNIIGVGFYRECVVYTRPGSTESPVPGCHSCWPVRRRSLSQKRPLNFSTYRT